MRSSATSHFRRSIVRLGLAVLLAVAGISVLPSTVAFAATNLTVTTIADVPANTGACGNAGIIVPPSPLSLREATCLANNIGGAVNINVPAGSYSLTNGELAPGTQTGQNVSMVGAGSASTVISAGGLSRVIDIDSTLVGGITATISGVTITGGADNTFGGGGIIAGSGNSTTADSLTLSGVVVTGNTVTGPTSTSTVTPGGGMQFIGGQLTISNSTFSNNSVSSSSSGSGLAYRAQGSATPEGLSISNSIFSGNTNANNSGVASVNVGGALSVSGAATSTYSVVASKFVNNSVTSAAGSGPAVGAAIEQQSGILTVTGSNFTGNSVSGAGATPSGGAIEVTTGTATLHYNRFTGNIATVGSALHKDALAGVVDATSNWWGCNTGPGTSGCDTVSGTATISPRLVLSASASPAIVVGPNATSTITASLATDSLGAAVGGANLGAFTTLPSTFSDPPGDATVTLAAGAHLAAFSSGLANIDYHSNTTTGVDPVNVTFDNATVQTAVNVNQVPSITSANTAAFNVGAAGSFTVTTVGFPTPAITELGTLPAGLTFTDNGDGTATLAGTTTGPGGAFPLALTANNGVSPNATQTLTVNVGQPPAITSPATAAYRVGTAGSFTVTTSGIPTVSAITATGTLPGGLTFTDNGNGTATLAGTPTAGTAGTYPLTLSATNGIAPNASQVLTVQVNQAPAVTTNPSDQTVNPGTSVTFSAAASGVPTPTVQWQRSTNGGASYTNIAGATSTSYIFTTAAGDNGNMYRAVFTNVVSTATTTAATLNVGTAPAFTSSNATTFEVGAAGSFDITTSGIPSATLSRTGAAFPAWATLTDNGDGTGTLTGTPPAGSGGSYSFTLKAANGFSPSASQIFTLSVNESPTITSANHATFTVGGAGAFAVTTTGGYPVATAVTKTGTLPTGVTFVDNGDGTALLSGTPAAGTSGTYPISVSATATGGTTTPATQSFTLTVNGPPAITSANHATFSAGASGSFTVTTTAGQPASSTLTRTGTLPSGVTFVDNGDGTAAFAGTPAFNTGGIYVLTIKASNGVAPDATQTFTLTVNEPPTITSANHAVFTVGAAAGFTVTTAPGEPAPTVLSTVTADLPPGITFVDNGDGTATIGGTPTAGEVYSFVITASNGVAPNPTQSFTATVNAPPAITSADHATFAAGSDGSFTVTTTPGTPGSTTITEIGALPTGVAFDDHGDGTATLHGTAAAGQGGSYPLSITASNGVAPSPTQAFTLTVNEPPTITSADHTVFGVGLVASFTVTTAPGEPATTVLSAATANLPPGITFVDNGDGTATISGTPTAGGVYPFVITASNGVLPDTTQTFTATVNEPPTITSADHATFAAGTSDSFTVTTAPGTPPSTALSVVGALPTGVVFDDNGDGTATLHGTAVAGQGGSYPLSITASNGIAPSPSQTFTLTVTELPAITSPASTAFSVGTAASFTVTSDPGYPAATGITQTGALPAGITFTDNGDGSATLAGTPATGSGGSYPLVLTTTNTVGHDDQAFTLTVNESPLITSIDNSTFTAGTAGTFTVSTAGGFPTPPALTKVGTLPAGITFTDNGDGTATLAGTSTVGGVYALTINAANGASAADSQSFTLTVNGPPSITSAAAMTFTAGVPGTYTVTTRAGIPDTSTVTETGVLPDGITFTDNGDGSGTLAGTAPVTAIGSYPLTITASNGTAPDTVQHFSLTIAGAETLTLPPTPPASDGALSGVPSRTTVGAVLHISGTGYAAGAPIVVGIYSAPAELGHATSDSTGTFALDVTVPNKLGRHVFVAAGIGADGQPSFLQARTVIVAAPVAAGNGTGAVPVANAGAGLADTGTNLRGAVQGGVGLVLVGLFLMAGTRRNRLRIGRR